MARATQRFKPPDMGGDKFWPGALIVRHVERAGIAPLIGGGDLGDDMIGPARVPVRRRDGNDAACLKRRKPILTTDDDMDRPAPKPVDDDEGAVVDVVGDAPVENDACDRPRALGCGIENRAGIKRARDALILHGAVHGLDDVAALAHAAQISLGMVRQSPASLAQGFGEGHSLQFRKTHAFDLPAPPIHGTVRSGQIDDTLACAPEQGPVDFGETLLSDHAGHARAAVGFRNGSEFKLDKRLRAFAQAARNVIAGDDEIAPIVAFARDDEMRMGLAGVVVIDRHPVEPGSKIALHLRRQVACEFSEAGKLARILRRQNDPELVAVLRPALQECLFVGVRAMPVIEARGLAVRAGPIPPHIVEVKLLREAALRVHADDAHLDQNTPVKLCARSAAF